MAFYRHFCMLCCMCLWMYVCMCVCFVKHHLLAYRASTMQALIMMIIFIRYDLRYLLLLLMASHPLWYLLSSSVRKIEKVLWGKGDMYIFFSNAWCNNSEDYCPKVRLILCARVHVDGHVYERESVVRLFYRSQSKWAPIYMQKFCFSSLFKDLQCKEWEQVAVVHLVLLMVTAHVNVTDLMSSKAILSCCCKIEGSKWYSVGF